MSALYPAFIRLTNRRCVVVGAGVVAERKIRALLGAGAIVSVIAPNATAAIAELERAGDVTLQRRQYQNGDLEGALLAFAATGDRAVNARVARDARRLGVLVNLADDGELCDFLVPAIVRQGSLTVAVSTSGRSPAFARQLREELERWLSPERIELFDLVAEVRSELREVGRNPDARAWQRALGEDLIPLLATGDRRSARRKLVAALGLVAEAV